MPRRITVAYNAPERSRYDARGEEKAVLGVLESVAAVHQSLLELGDTVSLLALTSPWEAARARLVAMSADIVFNLFEGFCGSPETEALLPEFLAAAGIPYTGCPAAALRLALDKARLKALLRSARIPTPDFQTLRPGALAEFRLRFPCIVKPSGEDASHGISSASYVEDLAALARQVEVITEAYGGPALVEEFIDGREFNATVLGNSHSIVLPASEIIYSLPPGMPRLVTFAAKWEPESTEFQGTRVACPAAIGLREMEQIAATARAAFRLAGCRGYARVDMRRDAAGELNVLEVNPNPDISPGTGAARQADAAGMSYTEFIEKIVALALEKEPHARENTPDVRRRQARPDADTGQHARV
jgi:D-alanine-D-alanine ligase